MRKIIIWTSILLWIGLLYSPFISTLCTIAFFVFAFVHIFSSRGMSFTQTFNDFLKHKGFVAVTFVFFLVLFSGIYTENWNSMAEKLRIKLPFLILPFAFFALPRLSKRDFFQPFYGLLIIMFISSLFVGIDGLMNYAEMVDRIDNGKSFNTPINHIRYSLLLTLAILSGYFLWKEKIVIRYNWERKVIGGITIILFAFIHILSVRSGLLALYAAIFVMLVHYIWQTKHYLLGGILIIGLLSLPVIAYLTVPSFKTKVEYTIRDLQKYQEGFVYEFSDGQRLVSWEIGIRVGNQNPLIGVGYGDVHDEVTKIYEQDYPGLSKRPDPHNQFIFLYAGIGLIGVILFSMLFFTPLFYQKGYQDLFFLVFHVVIFISFIPENTINSAVGTSVYIVPLMLMLNREKNKY